MQQTGILAEEAFLNEGKGEVFFPLMNKLQLETVIHQIM